MERETSSKIEKIQCGWSADWINSEVLDKKLKIVVPGPLITSSIVKMTPFIIVTSEDKVTDKESNEGCESNKKSDARKFHRGLYKTGIPDPIFDFLTIVDSSRTRVLDPLGLNSDLYNSYITEILWKDWHLSISQGIPDPWKNWSKIVSKRVKDDLIIDLRKQLHFRKYKIVKNGLIKPINYCNCC